MTKATKTARIHEAEAEALRQMACKILDLETLEERNMDSLDFHEHAVWQIEAVIQEAFKMGLKAAK
ncbi:MAG: DUF6900 domain-containing protein [Synechococcus sp.]